MFSVKRLLADTRGGIATIFAIGLPALVMLGCGAIEIASLSAEHSAMQDAADATALAMAKQLDVATAVGINERARSFAVTQLGDLAQRDSIEVSTSIDDTTRVVTVTLAGHRDSFFANLMPPGGWRLNAQATAQSIGEIPLCVLSYGGLASYNIHLTGQSRMDAPGCLVQSNGDINVDNNAALSAGLSQASDRAHGSITPAAQTGAPQIPDPFSSLNVEPPNDTCTPVNITYSSGVNTLPPGLHCANITVTGTATLQLQAGEHYFLHGHLQVQQNATLSGDDVVLIFDKSSQFTFQDSTIVSLSGRKTGNLAGFVVATTRENTGTFSISATSAEKLEGAIYIPSATLNVQGVANKVAQQSAWTVVVAQSIQLSGSADLIINSNYATSLVPVPGGVGDNHKDSSVVLKR